MKINTKRMQNRHLTKFFFVQNRIRTFFYLFKKPAKEQKLFSVKLSRRTKFFLCKKSIIGQKNTLCKTADGPLYLPSQPSFVDDMYKTYYLAKTQLIFLFCGKAVS